MKRRWATIYAILCTLLFVGGLVLAFIFSFFAGEKETLACLISMFAGFVFVPIFHEYGHLLFLSIFVVRSEERKVIARSGESLELPQGSFS